MKRCADAEALRAAAHDREQELQQVIADAQAEAQAATAAAAAAAATIQAVIPNVEGASNNVAGGCGLINEPEGQYNVQVAMGLANDGRTYRAIQVEFEFSYEMSSVLLTARAGFQRGIRELIPLCGIDWKNDFRKQDPVKLGKLFQAVRVIQ